MKFVQFLTWCFQKLSSFSYCWRRQNIRKGCFSFDRIYTSICIFTQITENQQLHCIHPSAEKFLFSSLTLHFCCFWDKVKILCISKKQIDTNLNIAVADSAGNPLSFIAVGGVAIFQVSRVKLSIICCCSRYHIFQIVLLELNLSLVIWGQLKTVKKLPP